MLERPQPASAPSELVTPVTASAASSAARARSISDLGAGLLGVEHVEARPVAGDLDGVGDAAKGVLGHRAGHCDRALDEFVERLRRAVARRHDRLLAANEDPQPEILAFASARASRFCQAAGHATASRLRRARRRRRRRRRGARAPIRSCSRSSAVPPGQLFGHSSLIPGIRQLDNETVRRRDPTSLGNLCLTASL